MIEQYKILYEGGVGELVEKKSRFIATARPVESEEEAQAFIEEMRKKYWDARHNCSAYVIGENGQTARCSDDGEPAQTAGRPILDVILGSGVRNICIVVTRYFGGVLLGTGGLVRAYSGAAQEGLRASVILEKKLGQRLLVITDYTGLGKIQYVAAQEGITIEDTQYTDQVSMTLLCPFSERERMEKLITEKTNGRAQLEKGDIIYYGVLDGNVLVFENKADTIKNAF